MPINNLQSKGLAMSGQIRLTPEQLRSSATRYTQGAGEIRDILRKLQSEQETIRTNWDGQAFRNFDAQFNSLKPRVNEFAQLLDDINRQLVSVANSVEETDRKIASQIRTV